MGAQAGLHMPDGYLLVECRQRRSGRRGGVAVHQHHVGPDFFEHVAHAGEHAGRNVVEVLPLLHNVEVEIGVDIEYTQHLVQHLAVLSCNTHNRLEFRRMLLELLHQGAHLYCLRPCSENQQYFLCHSERSEESKCDTYPPAGRYYGNRESPCP